MRAEHLASGLARLSPHFNADICSVCEGNGQYEQTYTIGCGMGSYKSMGKCDWCDGCGLRQGREPAPASVLNQVLQAAASGSAAP